MRFLLIVLLLTLSTGAFARKPALSALRTRIADDEKTLSIQIDGYQNGRPVHFDRTFAVAGMSSLRKEILTFRTFSSVGVAPPFRELPWLIFALLGLLAVGIALLTVSFQRVKATLMNPVKSLHSE